MRNIKTYGEKSFIDNIKGMLEKKKYWSINNKIASLQVAFPIEVYK